MFGVIHHLGTSFKSESWQYRECNRGFEGSCLIWQGICAPLPRQFPSFCSLVVCVPWVSTLTERRANICVMCQSTSWKMWTKHKPSSQIWVDPSETRIPLTFSQVLRIWQNSWRKQREKFHTEHTKSGLHAQKLLRSDKSVRISNPCLLIDYSLDLLCTPLLSVSTVWYIALKWTLFACYIPYLYILYLLLFFKKKVKFLSVCSHDSPVWYHIQG